MLFSVFFSFSQNERINCIIFIDGKLVGVNNGYFSYTDTLGIKQKIAFNYLIGDIELSSKDKKALDSLPADTKIKMNFSHEKYLGQVYNYSGEIEAAFFKYDYLVIRITNLNKRKGKYYFGYTTPYEIKKHIRQEHDVFEKGPTRHKFFRFNNKNTYY